jgi:hypothetical protein
MAAARPDSVAGSPAAPPHAAASYLIPELSSDALTSTEATPPSPPATAALTAVAAAVTAAGSTDSPTASIIPTGGDEEQVKEVLDRYRQAYEGLTARLARDVWPQVDEAALARAFGGLRSQKLTFDDCDLAVSGDSASVTCHGSTRYVPKVGSQDPRTEPRIWSFRLRKNGPDWKIQSMRAEVSVPTHTRR